MYSATTVQQTGVVQIYNWLYKNPDLYVFAPLQLGQFETLKNNFALI